MPRLRVLAVAVLLPLFAPAGAGPLLGQEEADTASGPKDSDPLPLEPGRRFRHTATEATWMSVDVSPDGRTLVFDLLGDLYTMPIEGGQATRVTSGMAYDVQPRFSPDGGRVAFVSDRSGHENVWTVTVDGSDSTQITKGRAGDVMSPEWTPDGDYLVVSKTGGSGFGGGLKLWLVPVEGGGSGALMAKEPENHHMAGAAFGDDPRYVWFASRQGRHQYNAVFPKYQLAVYDRETGETTRMTSRYGSAYRPTLSPDGRWLVYGTRHAARTGLRIRELATGEERWLAYPVQRDDMESVAPMDALPGMSFTPDSRHVVAAYGGKLWRIAVDGSGQQEIPFEVEVDLPLGPEVRFEYEVEASPTLLARQIRDAVPSPDGRRLAFTALDRLYVMDYPDGTPRRLAPMEDVSQHEPAWSPDGRWIAFVSWNDANGGHAWKVRADGGGQPVRLTRDAALWAETAWSPRGDRVVLYHASARDVQERQGFFQGGLASDYVWVPADPPSGGAEATRIGLTDGRSGIHFTDDPDRLWATDGNDGLVSFRWDDTDRRHHIKVTGQRQPGSTNAPSASEIYMAPAGGQALAKIGMHLYVVTVPMVGGDTPEVNVGDPDDAAFPARQLTEIGGEFPVWGAGGSTVHWSLGNAHVVYDLERAEAVEDSIAEVRRQEAEDEPEAEEPEEEEEEEAEEDEGYEPARTRVEIEFQRDVPEGVVVLRGGRAITMDGDEVIESADIVVRSNRIEAVGPRGSVEIPDGAEVIDVSGKTVLPGYVDTHYHTQWLMPQIHSNQVWEYLANLAYGVTTTQDVQTAITDILTYHDLVETGEMIGPRIYHTGPGVFSGENTKSLDHARDILRRYKDYYGLNTFKMYMSGNRQQRQWLIMAARELELMPTTEGGLDFKLNMTHTIDGYPGLEHSLPIYPVYDDVVQLYATTQTTYTPTLIVAYGGPWAENWFYTRESPLDDEKMLHFTPYETLEAKAARRSGGSGNGWFRDEEHVFQKHAETLEKFIEAGARIGVGGHGQLHGIGWHWELWAMQSGGMDEHDALRAATILGAEAIGFGNDLGSIEEGKLADLVILDRNPLQDIRATADVHAVMKNGRIYDGDTLDETWPRQRPLPDYFWMHQPPTEVPAGMEVGGGGG